MIVIQLKIHFIADDYSHVIQSATHDINWKLDFVNRLSDVDGDNEDKEEVRMTAVLCHISYTIYRIINVFIIMYLSVKSLVNVST